MLVKGYRKNLVVMKHIESDYIDEVYLILKPEVPSSGKTDVVKEANRIIRDYETGQKKKRLPFSPLSFFIGVLTALSAVCLVFVFL